MKGIKITRVEQIRWKDAQQFELRFAHVWGWATWRRAWNLFHEWDCHNPPLDRSIFQNSSERDFWLKILQEVQAQELNYTRDYQWTLVCLAFRALNIVPNVNLVSNIGFGKSGTNAKGMSDLANIQVSEMNFPIIHPRYKAWNNSGDKQVAKLFFGATSTSPIIILKSFLRSFKLL